VHVTRRVTFDTVHVTRRVTFDTVHVTRRVTFDTVHVTRRVTFYSITILTFTITHTYPVTKGKDTYTSRDLLCSISPCIKMLNE
jgi:hypothetical protein